MTSEQVQRVIHGLIDQANERGIDSLSEREKDLVMVYTASAEIANLGFREYLKSEPSANLVRIALAFRNVGFPEQAEACEAVIRMFPAGVIPADRKQRDKIVASLPQEELRTRQLVLIRLGPMRMLGQVTDYANQHGVGH